MRSEELKAVFDQQATGYDKTQERMAPVLNALYFLLGPMFSRLSDDARVLCVGAGTGAEISYLAQRHPKWCFTAVEPSGAMLGVCCQRAEKEGFAVRCGFHEGYLDSLPDQAAYDAATCFLVSQFILEQGARAKFFSAIANRLKSGAILVSSDLASGSSPDSYEPLLVGWMRMMATAEVSPEAVERMRAAYNKDVAILSAGAVASIIESGGFKNAMQFFQAGLLHAWCSERA